MRENRKLIRVINIFRYRLPLKHPVSVNGTSLKERTGLILEIITDKGVKGYGETAPLPGRSDESVDAALRQLSSIKAKLLNRRMSPAALDAFDLYPSVRYGLESALRGGTALLCPSRGQEISVNALIPVNAPGFKERLRAAIRDGFRSIKVKMHAGSLAADMNNIDILNAMLVRHPRVKVRIDANRKGGLDESVALCRLFDPARVEYVEEPTFETARLGEFHQRTGMGFALDESLPSFTRRDLRKLASSGLKAIVLKPTMIGGISRTLAYIAAAGTLGLKAVISSSYEVGPGFIDAARLACCAGPGTAHGLDTLKTTSRHLLAAGVAVRHAKMRVGGAKSYHFDRRNHCIQSVSV